jgi:hypothetical protein
MVCSLLGSLLGGVAVERAQVVRPLLVFSLLRVVGIAGEWWVSVQVAPSVTWVLVATCLEHALGGALTTVLFALMMRATDARIGASHFALLAALEAWGKLLPSVFSGLLASAWGYSGVFGLSTGLSLAFALFVQRVAALLVRNGTRPIRQSFRL